LDRALELHSPDLKREGCWIGAGLNYLYGTWQVLQGLRSLGYDMRLPGAEGRGLA